MHYRTSRYDGILLPHAACFSLVKFGAALEMRDYALEEHHVVMCWRSIKVYNVARVLICPVTPIAVEVKRSIALYW